MQISLFVSILRWLSLLLTKLNRLLLQLTTNVVKFVVAKVCYRGVLHVFVHIDSTFK